MGAFAHCSTYAPAPPLQPFRGCCTQTQDMKSLRTCTAAAISSGLAPLSVLPLRICCRRSVWCCAAEARRARRSPACLRGWKGGAAVECGKVLKLGEGRPHHPTDDKVT